MKFLLLTLLCMSTIIGAEAKPKTGSKPEAKPAAEAAHTEAFVGRSASLPLTLKGKESGTLDLKFGAAALESKWLTAQGFTKIAYTATKPAKVDGYVVSVNITNDKGDQLTMNITVGGVTGERLEGNLSVITKADGIKNYKCDGRMTAK